MSPSPPLPEDYKYPPDTSWFSTRTGQRRLRGDRAWKAFAICFCLTAPLAGLLGFWIAFGWGMRSFGTSHPKTDVLDLLALFTRFPVPHQHSVPWIIFNSVFWAACASVIMALVLGRTPDDEADQAADRREAGR